MDFRGGDLLTSEPDEALELLHAAKNLSLGFLYWLQTEIGHDRGAKVIARALRDAGREVIYTGLRQTPEMIAAAALQEDVDAVGISILSGAHMTLVPRVLEQLKTNGQGDVHVFVGGIIPKEDGEQLRAMGVRAVYGPGTSMAAVVKDIQASAG